MADFLRIAGCVFLGWMIRLWWDERRKMANEKRLIYSSDVLEEASKAEFMGFRAEERKKTFLELISAMLENCPKVDAVEVVRCRECKHFPKGVVVDFCRRAGIGSAVMADDFCSNGERRTDG